MGICLTMNSAPIQIDANLGWTAAVQEMLIYSSANLVRILPALPSKWNTGKVKTFIFALAQLVLYGTNTGKFKC